MTSSCFDVTHALGAYVVGAIDPQERAVVDGHLAICPACRDELASLAALPGLMSRVTADEVLEGPPAMDGGMLERLLAAAAQERRVSSRRRWLAAAAAVIFLGGASTGGVAIYTAATATNWPTVTAAQGPVHMKVEMGNAATGTALILHLSGVRSEEGCSLIAVSDTGTREVAGWWEATYGGTAVVHGTTSIPLKHLAQLVIQADDGQTLVTANV